MPAKARSFRSFLLILALLAPLVVPANTNADPQSVLSPQAITLPGGTQKLTVRLRDMPMTDALKLLAQRLRVSFSLAPDVKGLVNYDFYNESINHILEVLLTTNGLLIRRVGDTYIISKSPSIGIGSMRVFQLNYASSDTLSKLLGASLKSAGISNPEQQIFSDPRSNAIIASGSDYFIEQVSNLIKHLDQPQEHKIFALNYIKASDAATLLTSSLFAGAQAGGVKFIPIPRDNSLMVVASREDLGLASEILKKVDRPLRQVLISVKVLELDHSDSNLLGVTISGASGKTAATFPDAANGNDFSLNYDPSQPALELFKARVDALVSAGKIKQLATPSLMCMDSMQSKIEITNDIVSKVTFDTTVNANTTTTTENVTLGSAGITLSITPKINPDGTIAMKVEPEVSSELKQVPGPQPGSILATLTSKRKLTSPEVRVHDGGTLIIGGLNQDHTEDNVSKVPLLGDIPILGALFRKTTTVKDTTELVIMVTPKIIADTVAAP